MVEGEATVESRFAARQSGTLTPIVGRDREIELMWSVGHWQGRVRDSCSSSVVRPVLASLALPGRSSMRSERDDHIRMTYQCSPYHADSAFYPVIQQMSFAAGINQTDTPDDRLDKIEACLVQTMMH